MTKPPNSRPQDPALAELYDQMISRDQEMWQRLTERDVKLQDRMMDLFARILENSSVDRVMAAGFDSVTEQLKTQLSPLRELTPQRAQLKPEQKDLLGNMRLALARPVYAIAREDIPNRLFITDSGNKDGRTAS
jgi:hypothetical protein